MTSAAAPLLGDATVDLISRYAASLADSDVTAAARHAVKRSLLDAIGCAIGAFSEAPALIARRLAERAQSTRPATLLGTATQTTPEMATFANGTMVRYLDFNDDYLNNDGPHPSDNIAGVMAACESAGASGAFTPFGGRVPFSRSSAPSSSPTR